MRRGLSSVASRWSMYARPSHPHGIYAVGTVVRVKRDGRELMIMALRDYNDQHATLAPSYQVDDAAAYQSGKRGKRKVKPRRLPLLILAADWLDACTDIVRDPDPLMWLATEAMRTANPIRWSDKDGFVVLFQNGARIAVLVSPDVGEERNLASQSISLETRKWRTWACVHATEPTCCSICRRAHPGRVLSTAELADRFRGGTWR